MRCENCNCVSENMFCAKCESECYKDWVLNRKLEEQEEVREYLER